MIHEFRVGETIHSISTEKKGALWQVTIDGRTVEADIVPAGPHAYSAVMDGEAFTAVVVKDGARRHVVIGGHVLVLEEPAAAGHRSLEEEITSGLQTITAPMPGRVVKIAAAAGEPVAKGQTVVVVEAMKMEHALTAGGAGVVQKILCTEGQNVDASQPLAEVMIGGAEAAGPAAPPDQRAGEAADGV